MTLRGGLESQGQTRDPLQKCKSLRSDIIAFHFCEGLVDGDLEPLHQRLRNRRVRRRSYASLQDNILVPDAPRIEPNRIRICELVYANTLAHLSCDPQIDRRLSIAN